VVPDPNNALDFQVQMWDAPSLCLAAADNSGNDSTAVVVHPCADIVNVVGEYQLQTWEIG
jgi:ribosome-interacting GTPase 1